jgi:hypothetical protein
MPDVAAGDGFGYTVVWQEYTADWDIAGRRVSPDATLQPAFRISVHSPAFLVPEQAPAIAGGSPVALVAFAMDTEFWGSGTWDIAGRILAYRTHLPVTRR